MTEVKIVYKDGGVEITAYGSTIFIEDQRTKKEVLTEWPDDMYTYYDSLRAPHG